jgi:hypothetical protein
MMKAGVLSPSSCDPVPLSIDDITGMRMFFRHTRGCVSRRVLPNRPARLRSPVHTCTWCAPVGESFSWPGCFMNFCRETAKMGVPRAAQALASRAGQPSPVPRDWFRGVPERYVAGANTRGRPASGSQSL